MFVCKICVLVKVHWRPKSLPINAKTKNPPHFSLPPIRIFFKRSFYFVNIHFGFYTPKAIKQMIQMKSLWITSWDYQNYSKWWFERQLPSATFFEAIQRECIRILISMKMTTTVTATCSRFDTTIHIAYIRFVLFALTLMLCDRQCNDAFSVLLFVDFLFYIVFHMLHMNGQVLLPILMHIIFQFVRHSYVCVNVKPSAFVQQHHFLCAYIYILFE